MKRISISDLQSLGGVSAQSQMRAQSANSNQEQPTEGGYLSNAYGYGFMYNAYGMYGGYGSSEYYYRNVPYGYEVITYYVPEFYDVWIWVDAYGKECAAPEGTESFPEINLDNTSGNNDDTSTFYVKAAIETFNTSPQYEAFAGRMGETRTNNLKFVYDPTMEDRGQYVRSTKTSTDETGKKTTVVEETIYLGPKANINTIEQEVYHAVDYERNGTYPGNMELSWEMYKASQKDRNYDPEAPVDPYKDLQEGMSSGDTSKDEWADAQKKKEKEGYTADKYPYNMEKFDSSTYKNIAEDINKINKKLVTRKRPKQITLIVKSQKN